MNTAIKPYPKASDELQHLRDIQADCYKRLMRGYAVGPGAMLGDQTHWRNIWERNVKNFVRAVEHQIEAVILERKRMMQ